MLSFKNYLNEKALDSDDIVSLIKSIKKKLKPREDPDARGIYKFTQRVEKTFREKGKLHPRAVVALMRISSAIAGDWGKNRKTYRGKGTGNLTDYPPEPTAVAGKV
ncbi:MAG: hypothetical protein ACJ0DH_06930 [bacterium]